jgi:uncharacterized repeat protein (TIGR01451 family)
LYYNHFMTMYSSKTVSKTVGFVTILALVGLTVGSAITPARASDVLLASVAITASPGTICVGQSTHITWSSTDATSISIDQGIGSVLPFGDRIVSPTQTTTYTITGSNSTGGHAVASATVYVNSSCATPTWTPTPTPHQILSCTPTHQSANSGERVSFSAYYGSGGVHFQPGQLTWRAVGGSPSTGTGSSFSTRFYTSSISTTQYVSVTDGYQTANCVVYVYGNPTPSPTPSYLRCSPDDSTIDSNERVTFTARGGDGDYNWYAADGSPTYGDDDSFRTRFTNYDWYTQHRYVTVTSGWQTATCSVEVRGSHWTPTPTPYNTLRCTVDVSTADSGQRVTFRAYGGNDGYSWYAADGSPTYGNDSTFKTRFYGNNWYSQYRSATVTSGWQTATCSVLVNGSYVYPTPYPTWTPYPTYYPTPTAYPYVDPSITLSQKGRNLTRGQSGEHSSLTARGGDTLDILIRVRSTNNSYVTNAYVTDLLPGGLAYIAGSTTVNGRVVGDGITTSGINIGTLSPYSDTVVKISVRVSEGAVPSWGTVTVNNTAQARADGLGSLTSLLPITLGTNASITAVAAVQTGPMDSVLMALFAALLVTGLYAAYTRTDMFGRRVAVAEVARLTRSPGLNFSK